MKNSSVDRIRTRLFVGSGFTSTDVESVVSNFNLGLLLIPYEYMDDISPRGIFRTKVSLHSSDLLTKDESNTLYSVAGNDK